MNFCFVNPVSVYLRIFWCIMNQQLCLKYNKIRALSNFFSLNFLQLHMTELLIEHHVPDQEVVVLHHAPDGLEAD